jgi:hypothetical protein
VTGGRDGAVAFGTALVEVADQQVGAAGVAQIPDLREQPGDGDRGVGRAAVTQMITVGVDEGRAVGRGDAQGLRFGHAGVAFDRVQSQVEAAGAVEQTDSPSE